MRRAGAHTAERDRLFYEVELLDLQRAPVAHPGPTTKAPEVAES